MGDKTQEALDLISNYRRLKSEIEVLDVEIEKYAVGSGFNYNTSTAQQLEKLLRLIEQKRRVVNKVLWIREAIKNMPIDSRRCLVYYYVYEQKYRNIEEKFCCSRRTYYRRRIKALEIFSQKLEESREMWEC